MFEKQIKVSGEYVKGMIKNGTFITNQLVTTKTGMPLTSYEVQNIIEELLQVRNELEK